LAFSQWVQFPHGLLLTIPVFSACTELPPQMRWSNLLTPGQTGNRPRDFEDAMKRSRGKL